MGEVYKVRHSALQKSFALKILPEELNKYPSFAARFKREMETVSRLDHPNIVMTTDGGMFDGLVWFTMTYVAGTDAQHALGDPPKGLPPQDVAHIVEEVAQALDYAHASKVLHRDIKPANILLGTVGETTHKRVYLTDFGIAKAIDDVRSITTTSQAPMTLDFASPEQINGKVLDSRTDVYSLGATLYTLLTGSVPFPGIPAAKIYGHCTLTPPEPTALRPELDTAFDEIVAIAMAKDPQLRYRTCGDLAAATQLAATGSGVAKSLDTVIEPPSQVPTLPVWELDTRRPRKRVLRATFAAATAVAAAGLISLWWVNADHGPTAANSAPTPSAIGSASTSTTSPTQAVEPSTVTHVTPTDSASLTTSDQTQGEVQPLAALLTPAPEHRPGIVGGSTVASEPSYLLQPRNCPQGSETITVDLGSGLERISGNIQLDANSPASARTRFEVTADGVVLDEKVLSPTSGTSFDLNVHAAQSLVITIESVGQGSCDSDHYVVFFTSAVAYPRQS